MPFEHIPRRALDLLPLTPEPVSGWDEGSDVLGFLTALFDQSGTLVTPDGAIVPIEYAAYGAEVLRRERPRLELLARTFTDRARRARPAPAAVRQEIDVPSFLDDPRFGRMAKYAVAWEGVQSAVLSESGVFSIPHLLEAATSLDASIQLAVHLSYKHAIQVLRDALDAVAVQLIFCEDPAAFDRWGAGGPAPSPRERADLIPVELRATMATLYDDLDRYHRGDEAVMIHAGFTRGRWMGRVFQEPYFEAWCEAYARVLDTCIRLLKVHADRWRAKRRTRDFACETCHAGDDFDVVLLQSHPTPIATYTCRSCGSAATIDVDRVGRQN